MSSPREGAEPGGGGWTEGRKLKARGAGEGWTERWEGSHVWGAKESALGGAPKTTAGPVLDFAAFLALD